MCLRRAATAGCSAATQNRSVETTCLRRERSSRYSATAVALYLLDRSRRKQVVSTLRFWVAAEQPAVAARRKHINQPWSLLLQLFSMALLLLAIAQLRLGSPALAGRESRGDSGHVVMDGRPVRQAAP